MSSHDQSSSTEGSTRESDHLRESYSAGQRAGLAIAALGCSAVAFVNLLGVEKAILAIVLAILASRGAAASSGIRRLASITIIIASIYIVTFVTVLLVFHAKLGRLIDLLHQLG